MPKRTVSVAKIEDGQTVVYPLSVVEKDIPAKEYVDVVYDLTFAVKDAQTGAVIEVLLEVTPAANSEGNMQQVNICENCQIMISIIQVQQL